VEKVVKFLKKLFCYLLGEGGVASVLKHVSIENVY
jgi:hypothetical protein